MACNIDHTNADTAKKLESQKTYLPKELYEGSEKLLAGNPDQETLNELFHLLKKYDLASESEKEERNNQLRRLV
jgi:hypothetical protein